MTEFLLGAAVFVLATVAVGLIRILRGPSDADRLLAAQLLGTGGVAALLLLGVATSEPAVGDLAVVLTALAAFSAVGFVTGPVRPGVAAGSGAEDRQDADAGRADGTGKDAR